MTRQEEELAASGNPTGSTTAGTTKINGAERTIVIYTKYNTNDSTLFLGSKTGVYIHSTDTLLHEMGHAVVFTDPKIMAAFLKFVNSKKIKPVTIYAAKNVNIDYFPEAYALFNLDPEWMRTNIPDLYTWFDTFSKTGNVP